MGQRSTWLGIIIGIVLCLAPLAPASAAIARSHATSTKGSNPNSAMCRDVRNEQSGSSSVGASIEKALTSGNFAQAKQAMLNAYNADQGNVQKALSVIRSAPGNVQAAFKNLLSFVKQIRTDIQNATSLQGLIASFSTLGKNTQLENDGVTIANWYASVCGGSLVTTPTT
jgi:hypothetical protein